MWPSQERGGGGRVYEIKTLRSNLAPEEGGGGAFIRGGRIIEQVRYTHISNFSGTRAPFGALLLRVTHAQCSAGACTCSMSITSVRLSSSEQACRQAGRQASPINPAFVRNWVGLVSALKHDIYYIRADLVL